jgi:hypothetical protein
VDDDRVSFQSVAAYVGFGLGILNAGLGVIALWWSSKEAVRKRQRELRGRLRDIALELLDSCDEISSGEIAVNKPVNWEDYLPRLERVRVEGLLSPSVKHLEKLEQLLRLAKGLDQKENAHRSEKAREESERYERWFLEYCEEHGHPPFQTRILDLGDDDRPPKQPEPVAPVVDPVIDQIEAQRNTLVVEIRSLAGAFARAATRIDNAPVVAYLRWRWF